jgi:hypothetical protein
MERVVVYDMDFIAWFVKPDINYIETEGQLLSPQ